MINNTPNKEEKNSKNKIRYSAKPKGDAELKNILYRTIDKRYIGRKMINGQIITVYAKTQKECADKLKKKIKEYYNHPTTNQPNNKYLLKDMFLKWYQQEKEPFLSKGSKEDILNVYRILKPIHEQNIKKLSKQNLIKFFSQLQDNRSKEKTKIYLNACLKYYLNEGLLFINPCANIKVKKSHNKKQAFTYEQQLIILKELKNKPLQIPILIYLITGLRRREFNFASIEKDIDFDNQILKAINLKGRNLIKRYKYIKLSKKAISLIMNNLDIIHSYNDETVYREFSNLLQEINISGSIVNLRHTFATNCFYLGKPELIISREMGHSTSIITKDIYTDIDYHLSAQKIRDLYNNLYNETWLKFWLKNFNFFTLKITHLQYSSKNFESI